jgi:hypothetical protein
MAEIVLRMTLLDDNEYIVDYGTEQMADSALDQLEGGYIAPGVTYDIVSWVGPNEPRLCIRCGCDPHGDEPCPACDHVLCRAS